MAQSRNFVEGLRLEQVAHCHVTRGLWHVKKISLTGPVEPMVETGFWRKADALAYEQLLHQMEQARVPAQRWRGQHNEWPWHWVTTTAVPGERMSKDHMRVEHVASVAEAVARLHHIRAASAGPLWGLHWPGHSGAGHLLWSCFWVIDRAKVAGHVSAALKGWLKRHEPVFRDTRVWSLTHGDVKSGNLIWHPTEARAYLIDYEHMRYHWPELEVAALLQSKFRHPKHKAIFLDCYLALCPAETAASWARDAEVFEIAQLLSKAYRRWVQWRFPWFERANALSSERRYSDMRKLVEKAGARVLDKA